MRRHDSIYCGSGGHCDACKAQYVRWAEFDWLQAAEEGCWGRVR